MRSLASRSALNSDAYLGVQGVLGTGYVYGTPCVLDSKPHHFTDDDLDLLVIVSAWLRLSLECNHLTDRTVFDAE